MKTINSIDHSELIYPDDITDSICDYLNKNNIQLNDKDYYDLLDGLYYLKTASENPFNSKYFRTLYDVLAILSESFRT